MCGCDKYMEYFAHSREHCNSNSSLYYFFNDLVITKLNWASKWVQVTTHQ